MTGKSIHQSVNIVIYSNRPQMPPGHCKPRIHRAILIL